MTILPLFCPHAPPYGALSMSPVKRNLLGEGGVRAPLFRSTVHSNVYFREPSLHRAVLAARPITLPNNPAGPPLCRRCSH